jgi:magnesium-transporting ATPase (P-type)
MVDHDPKTGEASYQASSPDELALVNASKDMGVELTERTRDYLEIVEDGIRKEYRVLAEFPFNSDRKRMSVIIESGGKYVLYCKGADSIMEPLIRWREGQRDQVFDDLERFAVEGLRTLVMAQREISSSEYRAFADRQTYLETSSFKDKEEQLFQLYSEYEQDLELVGASAIEDKLQDNVPETISKLMSANIRVWVLTGDKQETAIEIAKSCQLIQEGMQAEILTIDLENCKQSPILLLKEKIQEIYDKYDIKYTSCDDMNDESQSKKKQKYISENSSKNLIQSLSIVIDGPTLGMILGDTVLELEFFSLAIFAKSVV